MMSNAKLICNLCNKSDLKPYCNIRRNYGGLIYHLSIVKCSNCGFVFLENDPKTIYDKDYLYRDVVASNNLLAVLARFHAKERVDSIARFVRPSYNARFLDIGIGDGLLLSLAEKAGYRTFGLDVNPAGVELAKKGYNLKAIISTDPLEDAFAGQQFNVIHMNEVIEHICDVTNFLKWCRRHLAEGILVVQTGNIESVVRKIKGDKWDYFQPVHVNYFSSKSLLKAITKAGFKQIQYGTIDWRLSSTLGMTKYLYRNYNTLRALDFLGLYLTSLVHGVRRSILVYAF
jgi:2-polyprenyl-3-methyl-5-hydroxy-6-metoxy-1,4-benzoquinol methylase